MWTAAVKEHPHLADAGKGYVRRNIIKWMKGDKKIGETATLHHRGYRRLVKNLKWQFKHGFRGLANERVALKNAIQWSNTK